MKLIAHIATILSAIVLFGSAIVGILVLLYGLLAGMLCM